MRSAFALRVTAGQLSREMGGESWWTKRASVGTQSRTGCGRSINCSTRRELNALPASEVIQSEQRQSGVVSARRVFCPHPTLHAPSRFVTIRILRLRTTLSGDRSSPVNVL
jgi:hypothetical protein